MDNNAIANVGNFLYSDIITQWEVRLSFGMATSQVEKRRKLYEKDVV